MFVKNSPQARTRAISLARAMTRAEGLRIRSGQAETFLTRLAAIDLSASLKEMLSTLRSVIEILDDEIANADERFEVLVAPSGYGTLQAFAVVDDAALAARSNKRQAVRTLVDAVFDRELPDIRCGSSLRRRVAEAEWQFRSGTKPPVTEQTLASVANEVLKTAGAPPWARTSVEEMHFMRMLLREELPRFVGTVDSERQLSEKMSPTEAVFVVMTLGRGMVTEPEEFRDGPEAYVTRTRERLLSPLQSAAVLQGRVMDRATVALADGGDFDDQRTLAATSAQRFFDGLDFPR